jgi:tRNA1Val (adenine37-N6)-methyltransferase
MAGLYPSRVCSVKTTPRKSARRYLLAFRKHPEEIETSELLMNSDAYHDLVKDFYLKG